MKTTLATIKAYIRKNEGRLYIRCKSSFDGMVDGVRDNADQSFSLALKDERGFKNTCGIQGAWFVFGSRDWFTPFEDETFTGFEVSNCCGQFFLVTKKEIP